MHCRDSFLPHAPSHLHICPSPRFHLFYVKGSAYVLQRWASCPLFWAVFALWMRVAYIARGCTFFGQIFARRRKVKKGWRVGVESTTCIKSHWWMLNIPDNVLHMMVKKFKFTTQSANLNKFSPMKYILTNNLKGTCVILFDYPSLMAIKIINNVQRLISYINLSYMRLSLKSQRFLQLLFPLVLLFTLVF